MYLIIIHYKLPIEFYFKTLFVLEDLTLYSYLMLGSNKLSHLFLSCACLTPRPLFSSCPQLYMFKVCFDFKSSSLNHSTEYYITKKVLAHLINRVLFSYRTMSKMNICKGNKKRNGKISRYSTAYCNKIYRITNHSFIMVTFIKLVVTFSERTTIREYNCNKLMLKKTVLLKKILFNSL